MATSVELKFTGSNASRGRIELYDVAQALVGFERSIAITTHAVLNGTVITQAPSLDGAQILALPPEHGSWKIVAGIVGTVFAAGQASHDSVVGHLTFSAYDYVVSQSLGVHVDFDKSLGQLVEEAKAKNLVKEKLSESRLDSVIEKCEVSIRNIHRPISHSGTATKAAISFDVDGKKLPLSTNLDEKTYLYISESDELPDAVERRGFITSYNVNTFKGRVFTYEDGRPIPFELADHLRNRTSANIVTSSLRENALYRSNADALIEIRGKMIVSKSGVTKGYLVTSIASSSKERIKSQATEV